MLFTRSAASRGVFPHFSPNRFIASHQTANAIQVCSSGSALVQLLHVSFLIHTIISFIAFFFLRCLIPRRVYSIFLRFCILTPDFVYHYARIARILAFKLSITHPCTSSFRWSASITSSSLVPVQIRWWMITFSCCPCRCSLLFAWVYNS